ncbi:hypothetical protein CEXT_451841 [Caerostris extrusa]|uniref:Uncharacterized protein n=1 Tax=Caerostris extrusa TaxID=172846 RepID=A0AAV4PA73_CAEEX|nr:hypothetical protein CEXT_451841 [Caerostris extrusa]
MKRMERLLELVKGAIRIDERIFYAHPGLHIYFIHEKNSPSARCNSVHKNPRSFYGLFDSHPTTLCTTSANERRRSKELLKARSRVQSHKPSRALKGCAI